MKFHYSKYQKLKRRRRKMFEALVIMVVIAVFIVGGIYLYMKLSKSADTTAPVATELHEFSHQPQTKDFETSYFYFQTLPSWQAVPAESTANKFVYRSYNSTLVEQDLVILVNQYTKPPEATHVQPVSIKDNRLQALGSVSGHCKEAATPGNKNSQVVVHYKVTYLCDNDGTIFSVLVGEEGDDGILSMTRADGSMVKFTFLYRDLSFSPTGRDLSGILRTFRPR